MLFCKIGSGSGLLVFLANESEARRLLRTSASNNAGLCVSEPLIARGFVSFFGVMKEVRRLSFLGVVGTIGAALGDVGPVVVMVGTGVVGEETRGSGAGLGSCNKRLLQSTKLQID